MKCKSTSKPPYLISVELMPLNPAAFLLCVVLSRASSNLQFTSIDFINFFGTRQLHFLTDIFIISQCLIVPYPSILSMSLTYVHILHEIICCILPPMNLIFCIDIADEFIPWFLWYFLPKFCILFLMFLNISVCIPTLTDRSQGLR